MPDDSIRSAIDIISKRLQDELEAQLEQLSARQRDEVHAARRTAEGEAEQRWSARMEALREEWTQRLQSEVESARNEAERRMVAESTRLRSEAEQAVAEATARVRDELTRELAQTRDEAERRLADEAIRLRTEGEQAAAEAAARVREELGAELERARAEAEQRLAAETARLRAEGEQAAADAAARARQELEQAFEEARAETARRTEAEANRLRTEGEQAVADATARVRGELERALEQAVILERDRGSSLLDTERQQFAAVREDYHRQLEESSRRAADLTQQIQALHTAKADAEAALARERLERADDVHRYEQAAAAAAEARVSERQSQLAVVERLLAAVRSMDTARTLSDVLGSLLASASAAAPRAALFVVSGATLRSWKTTGFNNPLASLQVPIAEAGLLGEVCRRGEALSTADGAGPPAPGFAALPPERAAIAVPLIVGAQPVAVLYADDGAEGATGAPASWPEVVQILGRHASVNLAHLTAARAAEAMRTSLAGKPDARNAAATRHNASAAEDGNSARRYARLLVSEIKLYNESAVRIGREKHDLLERLKPEIDRARRLYEQRISPGVDERGALFQQELIQTLAGGDPTLLGGSA
jgi:hypothetical protein